MVPVQFVEELAEELITILSHMKFEAPKKKGAEINMEDAEINIFQYGLPIEKANGDPIKKFPYVLIEPMEGQIPDSVEEQKVKVQLLIGLHDNESMNHGKKQVLNIINDICERFLKNPVLKNYHADEKITWLLDTEDEYPFHYGAVLMEFYIPSYGRENEYA